MFKLAPLSVGLTNIIIIIIIMLKIQGEIVRHLKQSTTKASLKCREPGGGGVGWISYFVPTAKFPQGLDKVLWDDLSFLATGFGFLEQ